MSRSVFDDPDLDVPKHCGNRETYCILSYSTHIVNDPKYDVVDLPYPDSLHVPVPRAHCGCFCDACVSIRDMNDNDYEAALKRSHEAYKAGKPLYDSKCQLCVTKKRQACGPKRTSTARPKS